MTSKNDRKEKLRAFLAKKGYSYEHKGFLDGGRTVYGIFETKRGARYYVRAFSQTDMAGSTVVVRSTQTTARSNPNSIKALINNQVVKGKVIGRYNIPASTHRFRIGDARAHKTKGLKYV